MRQPELLESHPPRLQLILAIVVPAVFGLIVGLFLGISEIVYLVLSVLGIAGGYLAGKEHIGAEDGAIRGFTGGLLFGTFILAGDAIFGMDRKAHLPEPDIMLVVITTVLGIILGALGGRSRQRGETRLSASTASSSAPSS